MWLSTDLGLMPFTSFTSNVAQATSKADVGKLKNFEFDYKGDLYKENITNFSSKFAPQQIVYSLLHNRYATIVKDQPEDIYVCRLRLEKTKPDLEDSEITLSREQITSQIKVIININTKEQTPIAACFEVDINDKINETIKDLVQISFGLSGYLLNQGAFIGDDETFVARSITMNEKFLLVAGGPGQKVKPVPWRRAKKQTDGTWHGSSSRSDAIIFIAQRKVTIYGFMWHQHKNMEPFKLKCQYRVDKGEPCEWFDLSVQPDEAEQWPHTDEKFHYFYFQDLGLQGVPLCEGSKFEIQCKTADSDRFYYDESGNESDYSQLTYQELVFKTESSEWDGNSTNNYRGMYPGILYVDG